MASKGQKVQKVSRVQKKKAAKPKLTKFANVGELVEALGGCPSDVARGVGGAHVWGGNRPTEVTKGK